MKRCLNCMQEYDNNYGDTCPNCGYRGEVTQDGGICLKPGTILQGRYIIGTVIRTRDIDIFYNAWDALFERGVQVQEYFPRHCATRSGGVEVNVYGVKTEQYLEGMRLFCGQSRELIRLYKEEDIVTYHAVFQENRTAYAIMDVPEDRTLKTWLGGRILEGQELLDLLRQAIRAVDKCHKLGIYHGVIGQDTFGVTDRGGLVLRDFGSWRYISGKPGIVNYGNVGGEADVFGLAKTFSQIATGMDTEDEEKLKKGLGSGTSLNRNVIYALKKALSHETNMLDDFCRDLDGKGAKKGLPLPKWIYIAGAGAVMAVVISAAAFAFVKYGGVDKLKEIELPWSKSETTDESDGMEEETEEGEELQEEEQGEEQESSEIKDGEEGQKKVPGVLGVDQNTAEQSLRKEGFTVNVAEVYSDKPQGKVIDQNPKAGELLDVGEDVVITVSKGLEVIVMGNVVGKTEADARKTIEDMGLVVGQVKKAHHDTIGKGMVISQSVSQGKEVKRGTQVNLQVSDGKKPASTQPANGNRKRPEESTEAIEDIARREAEESAKAKEASEEAARKESEEAAKRASEEAAKKASEGASRKPEEKIPETTVPPIGPHQAPPANEAEQSSLQAPSGKE